MATTIKHPAVSIRDVRVLVGDLEGDEASELFAAFAEAEIEDAKAAMPPRSARVPPYKIFVWAGQAALEDVLAERRHRRRIRAGADVLVWISEQLFKFSPVKSGLYQKSHELFADGRHVEASASLIRFADEYIFVNTVPYARKIERGSSSQAPEGVYQSIAASRARASATSPAPVTRSPRFQAAIAILQSWSKPMPSKAVADAVEARLMANWTVSPIIPYDAQTQPPEGVELFIVVQYPVANGVRPALGRDLL